MSKKKTLLWALALEDAGGEELPAEEMFWTQLYL